VLLQGLGHQKAIERIAVEPGQMPHGEHMLSLDRQLLESLPQQAGSQG
jgi:hypothetical protein